MPARWSAATTAAPKMSVGFRKDVELLDGQSANLGAGDQVREQGCLP
jgi:hypothetical protein